MGDYDTDIARWSDVQADLLRRIAAGEHVNDKVDWENVAEEVESVGNEERKGVASALMRGMQHKLFVMCWSQTPYVQHWQAEIRIQLAAARENFRESMRVRIGPTMPSVYRRACLLVARDMVDAGPPQAPIPAKCPWALDDLLAEGEAALRPPEDCAWTELDAETREKPYFRGNLPQAKYPPRRASLAATRR